RARDPGLDGGGAPEQGDRAEARSQPGHRAQPRPQHAREARRPFQAGGRLPRLPERVGGARSGRRQSLRSAMTVAAPPEAAPRLALREEAHADARRDWWEWWLQRKQLWVRDDEPQLEAGLFRALCAGTGLPAIEQRSNFAFESAQDGARRFAGLVSGDERPFTAVYTRLGNPTTAYLERVMVQLEAHHVVEK